MILNYLENVGVATNIQLWFFLRYEFFYSGIVPSWIAAYVCYQNFYPLAAENLIFRELTSQYMAIDIAINTFKRL